MNLGTRIAARLERDKARLKHTLSGIFVRGTLLKRYYAPLLRAAKRDPNGGVLILRNRHYGMHPKFGPSDGEDNLARALAACGVPLAQPYYYDTDYQPGLRGDESLVYRIATAPPAMIVLSSYDCFSARHPRWDVIRAARELCGIPVVAVWWDSTSDLAKRQFLAMRRHVDLNVLIESSALEAHARRPEDVVRLWAPIDPGIFHPNQVPRDIPVSFVGSTAGYRSVRNEYLEHLKGLGIGLTHTGGQAEKLLSHDQYATLLRRSRISLNFSHSVENTHQFKGRVLEVMYSGALLMENRNPEIERYFKPMSEYVEFTSKEDLADKIRYFLVREEERAAIADKGRRKALELFGHLRFCDLLGAALAKKGAALPRKA